MCGRFSQGEPSRHISDYFEAEPDPDLPEGLWNVAPTETIRIVLADAGRRRLAAAEWGFRLGGDASRPGAGWINARAETAFESPAFAPALRGRRCIVPADAFYEWDRATTPRQPYAIGPSSPNEMLALAGIWTPARDGRRRIAILTTGANAVVRAVHDRMPVILARDAIDAWLDPGTEPGILAPMLGPAPAGTLRRWPVSAAVNRVAVDGPELLRPIELQPTLGL